MEFEVVHGDITEQQADALVNETRGGNDWASEILPKSTKEELQENATHDSGPILCEPVETSAPGLNAEYVIHIQTVGYQMHPNRTADSTQNILSKADYIGCESVVLPIVYSTGSDIDYCARAMFKEISDYEPDTLADVRVIVQDYDAREAMQRIDDCYQTAQRIAEEVRDEKKRQGT